MSTELGSIDSFIPNSQTETFARHLQNRLRSLSTASEGDGIEDTSWNGDQHSSSSENDIYYDLDSCPGSPAEDALETDFSDYINKHDGEHSIYPSIENNNHKNYQRVSVEGNGNAGGCSSVNSHYDLESTENHNTTHCYCSDLNHHQNLKNNRQNFHQESLPSDILLAEEAASLLAQSELQKNPVTNHRHCHTNNGFKEPVQYLHDETTMYLHLNKVSSIDKFTPFNNNDLDTHDVIISLNTTGTDSSDLESCECDVQKSYENSSPIDIKKKSNGFGSSSSHQSYPSYSTSFALKESTSLQTNDHSVCDKYNSSPINSRLHHNSVDSSSSFSEGHPLLDSRNKNGNNIVDQGEFSSLLLSSNNVESVGLNHFDKDVSDNSGLESFSNCQNCTDNTSSVKVLKNEANDLQTYPKEALSRLVDAVFSRESSLEEKDREDEKGKPDKKDINSKENESGEEESIEVRRSRFRRSSSLKTGKTPPGTPGPHKKNVRFADVLGLDLADVRTFLDEVPKVPKSAFEDLHGVELSSSPVCSGFSDFVPQMMALNRIQKNIIPLFQQPSGRCDFIDRVRECYVCLENAMVSDLALSTITGVIRVKNIGFHKSVHIRYSIDSWKSFADLQARYVPNSCDGLSDKFSFLLYAHMLNIGQRLEFAVRFQANGCQHWDNNKGANYVFLCIPDGPTKSDVSSYIPPGPKDTWASFY